MVAPQVNNEQMTMTGLAVELAKVQTTVSDSNRRLENIERNMTGINDLSILIVKTNSLAEATERRISIVETRAESIDKNIDSLATHDIRLSTLEKDIIENGELRISTLEKGKAKVFAILGTITLSGLGWFFVTYIVPLLHHA